jgi:uncharacterized protein
VATEAAPIDAPLATPAREIARGVAWLAGTAIAVRLAEILVGRSPLGAALAGAVIVDLAMTRAGVRWDSLDDAKRASSRMWQGIGIGVVTASALVFIPLLLSLIVGGATIRAGNPSSSIVFGLLRGASVGVRDEFLYHGLPLLVAARAGVRLPGLNIWGFGSPSAPFAPKPIAIAYAAAASTSALVFAGGLSWEALLVAASHGVLFAMLWARTNAAWAPVSAHAAWVFLAGVGLRGGFFEVSWTSGMLADGARARGLPALVCVFVAVLLTVFVSKKLGRYLEAPHGRAQS